MKGHLGIVQLHGITFIEHTKNQIPIGGVLEDVNPTVIAIIIAEGAHHLDLRGSNKDDPISVILARNQEVALIAEWLGKKATDNFTEDDSSNLVNF